MRKASASTDIVVPAATGVNGEKIAGSRAFLMPIRRTPNRPTNKAASSSCIFMYIAPPCCQYASVSAMDKSMVVCGYDAAGGGWPSMEFCCGLCALIQLKNITVTSKNRQRARQRNLETKRKADRLNDRHQVATVNTLLPESSRDCF